jgi:hypothetical protein
MTYNKLKLARRFKNFLRLTLINGDLHYNNLVGIADKNYIISAYALDVRNSRLQLDLVEQLNEEFNMSIEEIILTTANGSLNRNE